jgi:glucose/arabinose dehydrogenase
MLQDRPAPQGKRVVLFAQISFTIAQRMNLRIKSVHSRMMKLSFLRSRKSIALALGLMLAGSHSHAADKVVLTPLYPNLVLDKPVSLVIPPDGSNRQFLVQQRGLILLLPEDMNAAEAKVALDFTGRGMEAKDGKFEEGLLGLAFHPQFKDNGRVIIAYSMQEPKRTVYSELQISSADPDILDARTERVLLEIPQPYWNHHCGNVAFGPDGMLYIPMGDGGGKPGGDPLRQAQNLFSMNGKVLRIDVNRRQGSRQYAIPADNPFVGQVAVREEIWAYGFRNPWGMHFDKEGTLWLADVGQEIWEEINLIEKGGNYGWSWRDGKMAYNARTGENAPADAKFIDPIHVYDHSQGISITGGFIYRGEKHRNLQGAYIYGDWGYGRVWALRYDKVAKKVASNGVLLDAKLDAKGKGSFKPTAFCEDTKGEILGLDWAGKIFRLDPVQSAIGSAANPEASGPAAGPSKSGGN